MSAGVRGLFRARVARCDTICREHFEIALHVDGFPDALPGQFVQVLCRTPVDNDNVFNAEVHDAPTAPQSKHVVETARYSRQVRSGGPMLRRPFSIAGLRRADHAVELAIMGRVVGPGTAWLGRLRPGDFVSILGPLGRPFTMPNPDELVLLVAGGIGLPPIRWLAEHAGTRAATCHAIVGAQTRDLLPVTISTSPREDGSPTRCVEEFSGAGVAAAVTTDDGSCGLRGRVTDALRGLLPDSPAIASTRVYACGPEAMLRGVAELCAARGVACELAMERVMACGMGTCQSCVVPVHDAASSTGWRYALCCTEGPVFEGQRVAWAATA